MKIESAVPLILGLCLIAGPVQAESTLDNYLKKNVESSSTNKSKVDEAAVNKVYKGGDGFWRLDDTRATGGSCSVTYVSGAQYAAYVGPAGNVKESFIVFGGTSIPPIQSVTTKKMTLTTADGKAQSVQAFHAPNSAQKDFGIIFFRLTDIQAAMDEISDVEDVNVLMENKKAFAIKWEGGHAARTAMQGCLSGLVGATQAGNIAANSLGGSSTIIGTAYAKVALIAARQYPPKGWDVSLIRMTDEMRLFLSDAQELAARGETPMVPQKIKDLTSYAKIEDDKGNFKFTNLLPGYYVLRISFNYKLNRMTSADTEFVRCQGNLCVNQSVSMEKEFNEGAEVMKEVRINNNGETVTIDLSKKDVFRQGVFGNE